MTPRCQSRQAKFFPQNVRPVGQTDPNSAQLVCDQQAVHSVGLTRFRLARCCFAAKTSLRRTASSRRGAAGVGFRGSDLVEIGFDDQRNQLCGFPVFPENLFPGIPVMAIDQKKRSRGENEERSGPARPHSSVGQPGKGFGSMVLFRGHEAPYNLCGQVMKRPTILGSGCKETFFRTDRFGAL